MLDDLLVMDKNTIYFIKYKTNIVFCYISHDIVFALEEQGPEHIS